MTEAVFIIGIALGILLGLIVGVAVTALVMVSVDEADKAAAYYYGLLQGRHELNEKEDPVEVLDKD